MEEVAASLLPSGYGYEWTGTTYQEKEAQGHEGLIFGFASVLVFLSLAALYESWSIPFAVLMALPLGFFGALFAVWLRAYPYDIYTQIGIVTLIGLAAKNAILIVEFARMKHEDGRSIHDAALEAAQAPPHFDDFICLHPWSDSATGCQGRGRGFPAVSGNGRVRRHECGDPAGDLYRARALRGYPAGGGRQGQTGRRQRACYGAP
jgi:hypothetical protein